MMKTTVLAGTLLLAGCTHTVNTLPPLAAPGAALQEITLQIPDGLEVVSIDYDAALFSDVSGYSSASIGGTSTSLGGRAFMKVHAVDRVTREQVLLLYEDVTKRTEPIQIIRARTAAPATSAADSLRVQVMRTEQAFARTMADRDPAAFASFLSDEAIFFAGEDPTRGAPAVAAQWRPFFDGPNPPFSWAPDRVEVLRSGALALSTGTVHDPAGKLVGRFNSIWRREASGEWKIVFDKGSPVCSPNGL
jgi:ketosteroid isomerase-like protein